MVLCWLEVVVSSFLKRLERPHRCNMDITGKERYTNFLSERKVL
jgi:hypothetical protein